MRDQKLSRSFAVALAIFFARVLMAGTYAAAQTERILHNFSNNGRGESPYSGLVFDAAGNLYGTTGAGGAYGQGMVFELSPNASGKWTMQVLHNFGSGDDGQSPWGGSLLMDGSGNLYGATRYGGTSQCDSFNPIGCGTVFELANNASGTWTYQVIYNFEGGEHEDAPTDTTPTMAW